MTYPRAYAPQLTVSAAVAELRGCAGSQFDPAVVDALANLVIGLPWPPERPATGDSVLDRPPAPAVRR